MNMQGMCAVGALLVATLWLVVCIKLPNRRYGDVRAERIIGFLMLFGALYFAGNDLMGALLDDCVRLVNPGRARTVNVYCREDGPVVMWGAVLARVTLYLLLGGVGAWAMAGRRAATSVATQ